MRWALLAALCCAWLVSTTCLAKSTVDSADETKEQSNENAAAVEDPKEGESQKKDNNNDDDADNADSVVTVDDAQTASPPESVAVECAKLGCDEGEECIIEEGKSPYCQCIKSCPLEKNFRNNVCSSANITFNSECEFHRQECLCRSDQDDCLDKEVLNTHLDYYGACVAIRPCTEEELRNFPNRMAQWLKSVMESLDIRQELSVHYSELHRRSRRSSNPLIVPAIWEFCNVDTSHDRLISRTEFFPLIAPLKALEHCIGDFLDAADQDSNGEITLKEWGKALNIEEDEIEDICEKIPESS